MNIPNPQVVDVSTELIGELVRLARLALNGKQTDAALFIQRMAAKYEQSAPELSSRLCSLLKNTNGALTIIRGVDLASMPIDKDSRLSLLRVDGFSDLDFQPIWDDAVKSKLLQIISERNSLGKLASAGLSPTRSLLLVGPPGVGKTLTARWLASELNHPLLVLDLSAVISSFLGRTGSNLRSIFEYAKGKQAVLLLDELDAIAKRRHDEAEIGELKRLVTVLIQELDQWPTTGLLVAATNHPDLLDAAIWRRFDMRIDFTLPSHEQILDAIKIYLGSQSNINEDWLYILGELLIGQSYSDIELLINQLRREAVLGGVVFEDTCRTYVKESVHALSRIERTKIAGKLLKLGLSQREISSWSGISRDTLRKLMEGNSGYRKRK
jgi:MoxR-like ATPase